MRVSNYNNCRRLPAYGICRARKIKKPAYSLIFFGVYLQKGTDTGNHLVSSRSSSDFVSHCNMAGFKTVFKRYEKKYKISAQQKELLLNAVADKIRPDEYGESTLCNIYFDTPSYRLIRASIEKPIFKEKLRVRSYGTPDSQCTVFIELKKKYRGVVYKRRINMPYDCAMQYLSGSNPPEGVNRQILSEVDYFLSYYSPIIPTVALFYDRTAYYGIDDSQLRLTFDTNIRYRTDELDLKKGDYGSTLLSNEEYILEIKCIGSMPLWLTHELDKLQIFPASFSKYGEVYKKIFNQNRRLMSVK